jgi:ornithine cyclodeaminase
MQILKKSEIISIIDRCSGQDLVSCIENAFTAYSNGVATIPPVGYLGLKDPPGDVHIKYGYIHGADHYVIKIASGFYNNPVFGLPSSNGMMLSFDAKTGQPASILLDEGYLTDLRTALAGAVAAKHLAKNKINRIGIVGTGIQARFQLKCLAYVKDCRDVLVWGRTPDHCQAYKEEMTDASFNVQIASSLSQLTKECDLIVTTTPSTSALIKADDLQGGTHITAMGADSEGKQELDPKLFSKADYVLCDSLSQCLDHGELYHGIQSGQLKADQCTEIGRWITDSRRRDQSAISVADLTGIATQDIAITSLVLEALQRGR